MTDSSPNIFFERFNTFILLLGKISAKYSIPVGNMSFKARSNSSKFSHSDNA